MPGSSDRACIGSGITVKVTSGSNQVGSVSDLGTLQVSAGSLELVSGSTASSVGTLTLSGGTISGAGALTVSTSMAWTAGSQLGSGATTIATAATATVNPGNSNQVVLEGRTLANHGTLTWSTGSISMRESAEIDNSGTFIANAQYPTSPNWTSSGILAGDSSSLWVHNTGTFEKTLNSGTTTVQVPFDNEGTVSGQKGQLGFYDGGKPETAATGSWSASTGDTVAFSGGTFLLGTGAAMSGTIDFLGGSVQAHDVQGTAATLVLGGGTLEVTSSSTASNVSGLTVQSGGTLTGAGTLNVAGAFSWTAGTMAGTGTTALGSASTGTVNPGNSNQVVLEGRTLANHGTLTWSTGSISMRESAEIDNSGTFNANAAYPTSPNWTSSGILVGDSSSPWVHNTGTFQKASGTTTTTVQVPFDNEGSVIGKSGQLGFYSGGKPEVAATGSWSTTGTGTVAFAGGTFQLGSGVTMAGTMDLTGATVQAADIQGGTSGAVVLSAGSLEVTSTGTASNLYALTQSSGTLEGAGALRLAHSLSWTGGTMSGSGSTVLLSGATGTVAPGNYNAVTVSQRSLVNQGTLTWSSGSIYLQESAEINNSGTFNANAQYPTSPSWTSSGIFNGDGSSPWVHNTGTFQKASGTGTTTVQVPFDEEGAVSATAGQLGFYSGGKPEVAATGSWSATGTASIAFAGGTFQLGSGVSMAGTIDLTGATVQAADIQGGTSGTVVLSSGSLELTSAGTASNLYALTQSAGTLTGPGALRLAHSLSWTGGTMSGTGSTVLLTGATGTVAPGNYNTVTLSERRLTNQATLTWSTGSIYLQEGAEIDNSGTFIANAQYPTSSWTSAGILPGGGESLVHNTGTFEKTLNSGTTTVQVPFDNEGTVSGQKGQLGFYDGGKPETAATGSWSASTGDTVAFSGGTFLLGTGAAMSGTIDFLGGSVQAHDVQGTAATLVLGGGTLEVTSSSTASNVSGLTVQSGGTLTGAGTLNVAGTLTWTGGTMSGTGTTSVATTATGTVNPGTSNRVWLEGRTLANHGTLTWSTGSLATNEGAEIDNSATFNANSEDSSGLASGGFPVPWLHNTGTFQKASGTGTTHVEVAVANEGSIQAKTGKLAFAGGTYPGQVSTGSWSALTGASLAFTSGTYVLSGTASLTGTIHYEGGTVVRAAAPTGSLNPLQYGSGTTVVTGSGTSAGSGFISATVQTKATGGSTWASICEGVSPTEWGEFNCGWDTTSGSYPDGTYELRAQLGDFSHPPLTSYTEPITVTVDNTPPTGELSHSEYLMGSATVTGTASDNETGIGGWQLQITPAGTSEWQNACEEQTMPLGEPLYGCSIDTTEYPDGAYELRTEIKDGAGNTATSSPESTIIDNTPPTGSLTAPGTYISGSQQIDGEALDSGSGVATWTLQITPAGAAEWKTACAEQNSPSSEHTYSCHLETASHTAGSYELRAVISDNVGHTYTTAPVTTTIDNTLPTGYLETPPPTVTGTITLGGPASSPVAGVQSWQLQITPASETNWTNACAAQTTPAHGQTFTCELNTSSYAHGSYHLRAIIEDNASQTFTTPVVTTTIAAAGAPTSITAPSITGEASAGQALSAQPGRWSAAQPITYTYQWTRCNSSGEECTPISGATTAAYTLAEGDIAATLRLSVTATDTAGSTTETSSATATIADAFFNTSKPSISGTTEIGQTLTAETGTWHGEPPYTYTYQWETCEPAAEECQLLTDATTQTLTITPDMAGSRLRVSIIAASGMASATARSAPSGLIAEGPPSEHSCSQHHRHRTLGRSAHRRTWHLDRRRNRLLLSMAALQHGRGLVPSNRRRKSGDLHREHGRSRVYSQTPRTRHRRAGITDGGIPDYRPGSHDPRARQHGSSDDKRHCRSRSVARSLRRNMVRRGPGRLLLPMGGL